MNDPTRKPFTMQDSKTARDSARATDTRIAVDPLAVLVYAHAWLADLADPDAPLWADRRDVRLAGEVSRLDAQCPDRCDSRAAVSVAPDLVMITTGHAAGCGWFAGWLAARDTDHAVPVLGGAA